MQYGMPTLIENKSLEDNAKLCQRLGLQFVELNMSFPEYQLKQLEQTDHLFRIADETGIYYTIHLDENLDIASFNPMIAKAYRETVRRTINAVKKLVPLRDRYGDPKQPVTLNMHMNHGINVTLPDRIIPLYERDMDTYLKSFIAFRSMCDEWIGNDEIMIAVENTDGFRDYEKRAIELLLESPHFGLTWDIGHSKATHEKDLPYLMEHQDHLYHFHIHDGTEDPPKNHQALGDGTIDLKERLELAKRRNARCVLETKTIAALQKSVAWLHDNGMWE
ncbi:MAG: sugar phosphate isomerase/epimerase [Erysipelotrichaceae bacterium]|nr:sugar phosphate isomerase/epimerase [Erysipelotrichaceae bacterium]